MGSLLLRRARVWPAPDEPLTAPVDVRIRDGLIAGITPAGDETAGGAPTLDVAGCVVTAGFWNSHIHLTEPVWGHDDAAVQAALDDMLLSRGFSSAVDLASDPRTTGPLLAKIDSGALRGPAIQTAGLGIRPPRGVPYYLAGTLPWYARWVLPQPRTAAGARRVVARQAARGARVIKLFTGSYVAPGIVRPMPQHVATAAVQAAHERGLRVLAHTSDRAGTEIALEASVDALAHVPDTVEGTASLLMDAAARGIHVVPTLHMFAATHSSDADHLAALGESLRAFRAAGGHVLFGTDVGYLSDRDTRGEYEAVAAAGMTASDILRSLTVTPAAFFDGGAPGRVAVGAPADLTVLAATSQPTPTDFAAVSAVVRAGRVVFGG